MERIVGTGFTFDPVLGSQKPKAVVAVAKPRRSSVVDTVIAEAGGEGREGMQAVANVIKNRAAKRGQSAEDVVSAPHQFEGYGKRIDPRQRAEAEQIVSGVFNAELPDNTGGADHFHADSVNPDWAGKMPKTARIGGHTFYSSDGKPLGIDRQATAGVVKPNKPVKANWATVKNLGDPSSKEWQAQNLVTIEPVKGQRWTVYKPAAQAFEGLIKDLEAAGYPVSSSGGFNYRNIRGGSKLSQHAFGTAIDLNAAENPMLKGRLKTNLPANIREIAAKHGLKWGGDFKKRPDPMHFEYVGGVGQGEGGIERIVVNADYKPDADTMGDIPGVANFDPLASYKTRQPAQTDPATVQSTPDDPFAQLNAERVAAGKKPLIAMPASKYDTWKEKWEADQPGVMGDIGQSLRAGYWGLAGTMRELVNQIPGVGPTVVEKLDAIDAWMHGGETSQKLIERKTTEAHEALSAPAKAARAKNWVSETKNADGSSSYGIGDAWADPRAYLTGGFESLPATALTMIPGGYLAWAARAEALAAGATMEVAAAVAARTATIAGSIGEGLLGGAQNAQETKTELNKVPIETWRQSKAFQSLVNKGMSEAEAQKQITDDASTQSFLIGGMVDGAFGGLGDRVLSSIIAEGVGGGVVKRMVRAALREAPAEAFEEAAQSAGEQIGQNIAAQPVDPNRPVLQNVGEAAAGGAAIGGVTGAAIGAPAGAFSSAEAPPAPPPNATPGDAGAAAALGVGKKGPLESAVDYGEGELQRTTEAQAAETAARTPAAAPPIGSEVSFKLGKKKLDSVVSDYSPEGHALVADPETGELLQIPADQLDWEGKPEADEPLPSEPTHRASGKYDDGTSWTATYKAVKRSDGTFALERTLVDEDGTRTDHFLDDGTARKGGAPRSAVKLGTGIQALEASPEVFPSETHAADFARDDASSLGAVEPPPAKPIAGKTTSTLPPKDAQKPALDRFPGPPPVGQSVIVDAPGIIERTAGKVEGYYKDAAVVRLPSGEEIQVPLEHLFVDKRTKAEADKAEAPKPVARPKAEEGPTTRQVLTPKGEPRAIEFPDELHTLMFDVGLQRQQAKKLQGVSQLGLDEVNTTDQQKIADALKISLNDAGLFADDYRYRAQRHAGTARSGLPQKMYPTPEKRLKRAQSEFAEAQRAAAQETAAGPPPTTAAEGAAAAPTAATTAPEPVTLARFLSGEKGMERNFGTVQAENGPEFALVQRADTAIQALARSIETAGVRWDHAHRGDAAPRVREARKLASQVAGSAARLLSQHAAVIKDYQRANPASRDQAAQDLLDRLVEAERFLAPAAPAAAPEAKPEAKPTEALAYGAGPIFPTPKGAPVDPAPKGTALISQDEADARIARWKSIAQQIGDAKILAKDGSYGKKAIISLFDASGEWSKPWLEAGYFVYQLDTQLDEGTGEDLFQTSPEAILDTIEEKTGSREIAGVLAATPCTTFAASGSQWWEQRHDVPDKAMVEKMFGPVAARYFDTPVEANTWLVHLTGAVMDAARRDAPDKAGFFHVLENPIGRIGEMTGLPKPLMRFDPADFGNPYTKRTQLWGDFDTDLPIAPVHPAEGSKIHKLRGDKPADKIERSKTPEGFAYAFFIANDAQAKAMEAEQSKPKRTIPRDTAILAPGQGYTDLGIDNLQLADPKGDSAKAEVLRRGRENNKENLVMLDANGDVVGNGFGQFDSLTLSPLASSVMFDPAERAIIHHNHPRSSPPSTADIAAAAAPGMSAIYAHGHDGQSYRVAVRDDARTSLLARPAVAEKLASGGFIETVARIFRAPLTQFTRDLHTAAEAGAGTAETINPEVNHMHNMAMRDAGWLDYDADGRPDSPILQNAAIRAAYDKMVDAYAQLLGNGKAAGPDNRRADVAGHPGELARVSGSDGSAAAKPSAEPGAVERPAKPAGPAPARPKDGGKAKVDPSIWTKIGVNARGNPVYQDQRGVRSYTEGGIRVTETVGIEPGGGISVSAEKGADYTPVEAAAPAPVAPPVKKAFSAEDAAKARALLVAKLGANKLKEEPAAELDPEVEMAGIAYSGHLIEEGARTFDAYARTMLADLGEAVRPYLKGWYMGVKYHPRARNFEGMSPPGDVDSADVDAITVEDVSSEPATEPADAGKPGLLDTDRTGISPPAPGPSGPAQQGDAPLPAGEVGAGEPEDVGEPEPGAGEGEGAGVGPAAPDVDAAGGTDAGRPASDGRPRAGGTGEPAAGAGSGRDPGDTGDVAADEGSPAADVKDPDTVSPANPGPPDFHIDEPLRIVGGGQVARFDKNKAAIDLRNRLVEEGRAPTAEEQEVLAGYTGWGSFGQELFKGSWRYPSPKDGWTERDKWLRDNLGKEEWEGLQRSIINAHYTDPPTVLAMWDMVRRLGFQGGRVLEPSIGVGNFFGMMPADMTARSQRSAIELDPVTGSIAQMLYPNSNVQIKGYEQSQTPDNFYDVVIGNWPFANLKPADRRYNKLEPLLHDYFWLKALDQTRPGGLVIGITSKGTMDKQAPSIRQALAKKGELVAAFRLPTGAFEEYAGTKVVTDILILRKRPQELSNVADEGWIRVKEHPTPSGAKVLVNEYYHSNPSHVIGTIDYGHGTTSYQPGLIVHRPDDMMGRLKQAVEMVPEAAWQPTEPAKKISYVANHTADRTNALTSTKKGLFVVQGEHMAPAHEILDYRVKDPKTNAKRVDQLQRLVTLRKLYGLLIDAERTGKAETQRKALRDAYEDFVRTHGHLTDSYGLGTYLKKIDDPFYPALAALETKTGTGKYKTAAILTESTMRGVKSIANPSIADAFVLARGEQVNPTPERIAAIAGKTVDEVRRQLVDDGLAFETPNGSIEPADIYLSGNVRNKRRDARTALAEGNAGMQRNLDALEGVVPADIPYYQIETQMGATWVPTGTYEQWIAHMLGLADADEIKVTYEYGKWKVNFPSGYNDLSAATSNFGVDYREVPFKRLVRAAMDNLSITLKGEDEDGNEFVRVDETKEVNTKIADMRLKFGEWLWAEPERRADMEQEYNEARNGYADAKFDGSFLPMQGMALTVGRGPFQLRKHQLDAIWRAIVMRKSINAHEVGTGKTFTMGGIAVESRRYGLAKKPLLLAHNANSKSVAAEIQQMYPGAQVLYIDNLSKEDIKIRMQQIANDDWDVIVVPHSVIDRFGFKEETLMAMAQDDIDALESAAIEAADEDGATLTPDMLDDPEELKKLRSPTAKQLVKQRMQIINKIKKLAQESSRADSVSFEDLGVDMVLVDEAHEFKKPPIATSMNLKGLQTQVSDRSVTLNFMTKYIRNMNGGGNVHLFTGTPITNTITEAFNMMRYIMQEEMDRAGLGNWNGWFGSFAREAFDMELGATGEMEPVTRLAEFINVAELRRMIGQYMDIVFGDEMPEMQPRTINGKLLADKTLTNEERMHLINGRSEGAADRPYKQVKDVSVDMSPAQLDVFQQVNEWARSWKNMTGKERREAMAAGDPESPLIHQGIANKASFDVRLIDGEELAGKEGLPETEPDPDSKPARIVKNVVEIYKSSPQAAQVIFMQQGMAKRADKSMGRDASGNKIKRSFPVFSTMADMIERLVQQGIPRDQIATVTGSTSKDKRKEVADQMNSGALRVVIGSTQTLGIGVNMQRNLRAMHHMDAPWMPGDLEQRNGRGWRQGNQWNTVLEFRYMTDRLDGKRWQTLAKKQFFIEQFMRAKGNVRTISGDDIADGTEATGSDIINSFASAAGDPRLLMREKYKKKIELLQSRARIHSHGIADAKRDMRRFDEEIQRLQKYLKDAEDSGAVTKAQALLDMAKTAFRAEIFGADFTKSLDAHEYMKRELPTRLRTGMDRHIGSIGDEPLHAVWNQYKSEPDIYVKLGNQTAETSDGAGMQKLANQIRKVADMPDSIGQRIARLEADKAQMAKVAAAPFHLSADLDKLLTKFKDLQVDLARNPVAPPFWLRQGAPAETGVLWNGKEFTVTGHRWDDKGYWVVAEDESGEVLIPYMEVFDRQGMPFYEPHEFKAPAARGDMDPLLEPGEKEVIYTSNPQDHSFSAKIYYEATTYRAEGKGATKQAAVDAARKQKAIDFEEEAEPAYEPRRPAPRRLPSARRLGRLREEQSAISRVRLPTDSNFIRAIKGKMLQMVPHALGAVYLNYFPELAQDGMTSVAAYLKGKRKMDAYRGKKHAAMDEISQEWLKYTSRNRGKAEQLADLMHDATIAGVDPDSLEHEADDPVYRELRDRFLAMAPAGQDIYRKVRDAYESNANELDQILLDNLQMAEDIAQRQSRRTLDRELDAIRRDTSLSDAEREYAMREASEKQQSTATRGRWAANARITRLRRILETQRVPAPYFPLGRVGQYYVAVRDEDGHLENFALRETPKARDDLAREYKALHPNSDVTTGMLNDTESTSSQIVKPSFIADIEKMLPAGDDEGNRQIMDQIWQRYLRSLPELSTRKRAIHRSKIPGFDKDALRIFARHMFHSAHQMGRLKYGLALADVVEEVEREAQAVPEGPNRDKGAMLARELGKRHKWVMNPQGSQAAQVASSASFAYYLAASPAAALVNVLQTPMVGIPMLGARFRSVSGATAAIMKASRNIFGNNGLSETEVKAMTEFEESGLIDRTQSHDIAGVGETGVAYSPTRQKIMRKMSYMFHKAEVGNRRVTALAAYRMARAEGQPHDRAIDTASDLTWRTHFDYSNSSRARYMQSDAAKIMLALRSYQMNMLYRLGRDLRQMFKGATPQARKEARTQFAGMIAMQALFAGATGVAGYNTAFFLYGIASTIASALTGGDGDDDPFDMEVKFRQAVLDLLGPQLGGIALNGLPGHYLGVDLTSRVGMPDLWFRSPNKDLQDGQDAYYYLLDQVAGAPFSVVKQAFDAYSALAADKPLRAFEKIAPKMVKDLTKAGEFAWQGVTNWNGEQVVSPEDINYWELIAQASGFTPANIAEKWDQNATLKTAEKRVKDNRQGRINSYAMAFKIGDTDGMKDALADIRRYNQTPFGRTMPITGQTLQRSLKARAAIEAKRQRGGGVLIQNEALGQTLREQLPEDVYE